MPTLEAVQATPVCSRSTSKVGQSSRPCTKWSLALWWLGRVDTVTYGHVCQKCLPSTLGKRDKTIQQIRNVAARASNSNDKMWLHEHRMPTTRNAPAPTLNSTKTIMKSAPSLPPGQVYKGGHFWPVADTDPLRCNALQNSVICLARGTGTGTPQQNTKAQW